MISRTLRHFSTSLRILNPYTFKEFGETQYLEKHEAKEVLEKSASVYWEFFRGTTVRDRVKMLEKVGQYFETHKNAIAAEITGQMGKPITEAIEEVEATVARIKTLSGFAETELREEIIEQSSTALKKFKKEPVGVVLTILPWNYPILVPSTSIVPAFLCGNGILIKHSPLTPLCSKHFIKAFHEAGAPQFLINDFLIRETDAKGLYSHRKVINLLEIQMGLVNFTGSVGGAQDVLEEVALHHAFLHCDPVELSGKDAAIVCDDADLEMAASKIVDGAFYNAGQSCGSIERVYATDKVYDQLLERMVAQTSTFVMGDPTKESTTLGPLARPEAPGELQDLIVESTSLGADVLCGGEACSDQQGLGSFMAPTIVKDVHNGMTIQTVQLFGPVVTAQSATDEQEAVNLVNSSSYGASAAIFTKDKQKALKMAEALNVGTVFMNTCEYIDSRLPWSGRKLSGRGTSLSRLCFGPYMRSKAYNFIIQ